MIQYRFCLWACCPLGSLPPRKYVSPLQRPFPPTFSRLRFSPGSVNNTNINKFNNANEFSINFKLMHSLRLLFVLCPLKYGPAKPISAANKVFSFGQ